MLRVGWDRRRQHLGKLTVLLTRRFRPSLRQFKRATPSPYRILAGGRFQKCGFVCLKMIEKRPPKTAGLSYSTHSHGCGGDFHPFSDTPAILGDKNAQEMLEPNHAKRNSYKAEPPTFIHIRHTDTWNRVSTHLVLHIKQQDPHIGSFSYNFGWFCGFVLGHHLKTL